MLLLLLFLKISLDIRSLLFFPLKHFSMNPKILPRKISIFKQSPPPQKKKIQCVYKTFSEDELIGCLFIVLRIAQGFALACRYHHCRWRAVKCTPMIGAQGLWAGRDLYCPASTVTRGLHFPVVSEDWLSHSVITAKS